MAAPDYRAVPTQVDLPALEREVLARWSADDVFAESLAQTATGPRWTFYEGPPTANGLPGTHHVEARVFKDVFPRFKTMQGFHVERRAGWDCHGLPVELAVEKELGFTGKAQIEAYGVAEFNARCRESVTRHVDAFTELTRRMGFWLDFDSAYWTMHPRYVDSVWWALKSSYDAGLLVEQDRVSPYCPRCGTALSDHELGQPGGYETVVDPSVFVRLPLTSGPHAGEAALLVWTTTPWTLVSNTAVAVRPDVDYVLASDGTESLVVAAALVPTVLGEGWEVLTSLPGRDMERWRYSPPFQLVEVPDAHYVVLADYVSTEDGTGLVHQSPAFGPEDMAVAKAYGLPVVSPVGADGHFADNVPLVGGQFFKHADIALVENLQERGLLFCHHTLEHSYPHCWRCHTPLLYYALPSWYIKTTAVKDALLRENQRTTWHPATIQWGRYGDWLRGNVDWALSRDRYWGTPLPIWRCADSHVTCVGSRAELATLAGRDLAGLDPHRPYVDEVVLDCPKCAQPAQRVPQVVDAWCDSGSMPFAQWGYPYVTGSAERFEASYPAQFICEAIDQTRGWFYTLMVMGTMLFDRSSYEHVLCLGHIVAEDGRKMSKHLGNVVEPMALMEEHGADAVRWWMLAAGSPWASRRLGHAAIAETVRKVILTYWNTAAFLSLYARSAGWTPADGAPEPGSRPVLDRWLASQTAALTRDVTAALEDFDTQRAGQLLARYVDEVSNWYVRRSRRRFWAGDPAAMMTLHETLDTLTRLMAPMAPFVTERVWGDIVAAVDPQVPRSVHLATWPQGQESRIDAGLGARMALARRLVELGRAARAQAKVKTRQPLSRALVGRQAWTALGADLRAEVCEELNVGALEPLGSAEGELVDFSVKANYRALGKRFGKQTPAVAAAIAGADPAALAAALRSGDERASVAVDGVEVALGAEELIVTERPRQGWSVANDQGETIALDLERSAELERAGLAREVIRSLQEVRKSAGLDISDRIHLWWAADGELAAAVREHAELIAAEVLAVALREEEPTSPALVSFRDAELGLTVWLERAAAQAATSPLRAGS
jgi:isoleucyl-tRNA synthetase